MKYCAYQERCQKEVRQKLYEIKADHEAIETIITELIAENFLNEERFATSFARGKFYFKSWGKVKIEKELETRAISVYCINKALLEIDKEDYLSTIKKLTLKKSKDLGGLNNPISKNKIANFLYNKGFESDLIWETINSLSK